MSPSSMTTRGTHGSTSLRGRAKSSTETGGKIKWLQSDGGKEYFFGQFNDYVQQMGIQREFSCRYTPEQNDVTERKNRSVVEAARVVETRPCIPRVGSRGDGLRASKKGRKRCRIPARIGTSLTDASPTPRELVTSLQRRNPRRPRRPRHRLMRDYANLPAGRTQLCGSDATSTWRIVMRA